MIGTAISNQVAPVKRSDIQGTLVAQFDPTTCVLSGATYAPSLRASTPFSWTSYGGKYMEGPYIPVFNGVAVAPLAGIQEATFVE